MVEGPVEEGRGLTVADLLSFARDKLLAAGGEREHEELSALLSGLFLIMEAAWQAQDERVASLALDLYNAAQDSLMGVEWKSYIPSQDDIEAIASGNRGQ